MDTEWFDYEGQLARIRYFTPQERDESITAWLSRTAHAAQTLQEEWQKTHPLARVKAIQERSDKLINKIGEPVVEKETEE